MQTEPGECNLAPVEPGLLSSYWGSGWHTLQVPLNPLFDIHLFSLANANTRPFSLFTYILLPKALPLTKRTWARWIKHNVLLKNRWNAFARMGEVPIFLSQQFFHSILQPTSKSWGSQLFYATSFTATLLLTRSSQYWSSHTRTKKRVG